MNRQAFEEWMEDVIPQMVALSPEQTDLFFNQFLQRCSKQQKRLLEEQFCSFLRQDFMTLPDVIMRKIIGNLSFKDLLNLRLVCQSWNVKITTMTWLWTSKCRQFPVPLDEIGPKSGTLSFQFFVRSQRVVRSMAAGTAFHTKCSSVLQHSRGNPDKMPHLLAYSHDERIIVIGAADKHLTAVDGVSYTVLWTTQNRVPSCLYCSSELLLAGNHFGQVTVLSLTGEILSNGFQCGASAVTNLDVHPSGRFMIASTSDGLLHLADASLDVYRVDLHSDSPQVFPAVRKMFFLPDNTLKADQVAVCVCTNFCVTAVVLSKTGKVLHENKHKFNSEIFSFCQSGTEAGVLYTASNQNVRPSAKWTLTKLSFDVSQSGVKSKAKKTFIGGSYSPSSQFQCAQDNLLLLAVGRQLCIVAVNAEIYVLKMDSGTLLCTWPTEVLEGENVMGLVRRAETGRVLAVNKDWLDGLSPSTMKGHEPILLFDFNKTVRQDIGSDPVHSLEIKSLCWSPDLWGTFGRIPENDGTLPHSDVQHHNIKDEQDSPAMTDETGKVTDRPGGDTAWRSRNGKYLGVWRSASMFKCACIKIDN